MGDSGLSSLPCYSSTPMLLSIFGMACDLAENDENK